MVDDKAMGPNGLLAELVILGLVGEGRASEILYHFHSKTFLLVRLVRCRRSGRT